MPRIVGVDVPEKKKIRFALRYIHGIGPKIADVILEKTGISPDKRASELTEQEIASMASLIDAEVERLILHPPTFFGRMSRIDNNFSAGLEPDGLRLTLFADGPSLAVIVHLIVLGQALADRSRRIAPQ